MIYENHIPPEGINSSKQSALKELSILIIGMLVFIILLIGLLHFFIKELASKIPYSYENKIAHIFIEQIDNDSKSQQDIKIAHYLQMLANELAADMALPKNISIQVHYSNSSLVNAFATLGGHIFIHRGLIEKLPNENALSMVIGHEIAHIKYRHPITSLSKGLILALALSAMSGISDNHIANAVNQLVDFNNMHFSREQETKADFNSLIALEKKYGHIQGADTLFTVLAALEKQQGEDHLEFFSTHPLNANRIANIWQWASQQHWKKNGKVTQLPKFVKSNSI